MNKLKLMIMSLIAIVAINITNVNASSYWIAPFSSTFITTNTAASGRINISHEVAYNLSLRPPGEYPSAKLTTIYESLFVQTYHISKNETYLIWYPEFQNGTTVAWHCWKMVDYSGPNPPADISWYLADDECYLMPAIGQDIAKHSEQNGSDWIFYWAKVTYKYFLNQPTTIEFYGIDVLTDATGCIGSYSRDASTSFITLSPNEEFTDIWWRVNSTTLTPE